MTPAQAALARDATGLRRYRSARTPWTPDTLRGILGAMNSTTSSARVVTLLTLLMATIVALTLTGCSTDTAPEEIAFDGTHVSASTFAAATEIEGVTVIDVRTPEEFASGHLPGAVNLDIQAADFTDQVNALDPADEYAVYCRSGNRSAAAIDLMTQAGVTNTIGLTGGIGAWVGDVVTG